MIVKYLSRFIIWLIGWKIDIKIPPEKKYIIVIAPHTSNWDLIIGKLANWANGMKPKVLVKKEAFTFFAGPFIRMWGGIPVDREKTGGVLEQVVKMFEERDELVLGITPEGTRKRNPDWKTGFHRIARKANVPVYLAYVDFATKKGGMHQKFEITADLEMDMKRLKDYYKDMKGLYPEQFAIE
jgi:1-acyl-sn-glycerol-3-phosphate acyltransferase